MALAVLATVLGVLTQELPERLHLQCPPAPQNILVDGDLAEWNGLPSYPVTSGRPPPKKDVSGEFSFCYAENALYFAGRIVDDDFVRDGAIPWEPPGSRQVSDVIEVFFDLDLAGDVDVQEFDADDVQLFLMPLNRGRQFETYQWKGQRGLFPEYLAGARIATREHPDEGCYEFEVKLPLAPLGLDPARDRVVGFNVAINDSDSSDIDPAQARPTAPEDYYLSLNGKQGLFRDPTQLCVIEFQGTPPVPEAEAGSGYRFLLGTLGTIAVLAALVLMGVFALRFHHAFLRRLPRWRWALLALLGGLLVAFWLAPLAVMGWMRGSAESDVRARVARLREQLAPLARDPGVQERLRGVDESVLADLFEGRRFRPQGIYSFQLLDLLGPSKRGPMEYVSSGAIPGVPFLEYDIFIGDEDREEPTTPLVLKLATPVAASRLHFAVAAMFPDDVAQVEDALEVHLRFTNGAAATHRFTLDAASGLPVGHVGGNRTWGVADERGNRPFSSLLRSELHGKPLRHIDHRVYDVPDHFHEANQEALLTEISLQKTRSSARAVLWLSAITVERGVAAPEFVPLRLGSVDPGGFPFEIRDGRKAPRELALRRGESQELSLGNAPLRLDRLRLYYRNEGSSRGDFAEGEVRAQVEVFLAGESTPQVFPLRMGIEVTDEFLSSERLPPTATSFLASWYDTFRGRVPYSGYELPLADRAGRPGPFLVDRLVFSVPVNSSGVFHVGAATAAQRVEPRALQEGTPLVDEGGEVFLRGDFLALAQDADAGLCFAIARDGVVRAVGTGIGARLAARIRGTALPGSDSAGPEDVRRLGWAGHEFASASVALPFGVKGSKLVLLRDLSSGDSVFKARNLLATVLAIALLPFGLLALVDLLTQVTRIRSRLSFLFLSISVVPLTVVFLFLAKLVGDEQVRVEAQRAEQLLATAHRRFEDLTREATAFASTVLRQLEKEDLLSPTPQGERGVHEMLADRVAEFGDRSVPVKVRATFVSGDESRGTQVYYSDVLGRQDQRWEAADVGLSLCWGSVVFSGVAQRGAATVQVAGIVNEDTFEAVGFDEGQRESLSLLAPRMHVNSEDVEGGALLVSTEPGTALPRGEVEDVARALSRGQGVLRRSSASGGTREYDLVRTSVGDPVVIVCAGVQARPLTVDLGYARVPLLWFAALLAAVTLGSAWVLASFVTEGITRPLVRLQAGTRALAAGEEGVRVDPQGDDEVAELSEAFNRMSAELRRRIRDQEILSAVTGQLARNLDLRKRVSVAMDFLHEILGDCQISCYLYEVSNDTFQLHGARVAGPEGEKLPQRIGAPQGIFREVLRDASIRHVPSGVKVESRRSGTAEERAALPATCSTWLLPLGRSAHASGVLVLWSRPGTDPLDGIDRTFLRNLLAQLAIFFDNARLYRLAVEDPATGLAVHGFFLNRLAEEIDRVSESRGELAVVALRWTRGAGGRPVDVRKTMTDLAQEIRRVCHDRELVARIQDLEFEVLVVDGGRGRGDEVCRCVQERIAENRELAATLREGGWLFQSAVVGYPEDGLSRDFLLARLGERLEGPPESPAASTADGTFQKIQERHPQLSLTSDRLAPLLRQISRVAASDATVLILGETGTGKEVAAHLLHELSPRSSRPFVAVHCAALPEKLLESELFGHERGAFTGADRRHAGRFEQAQGGTLFLDEIAEIPLEVQVKLLRVLQERRVQRLGGSEELSIDVRLVAATHRSLEEMVAQGTFREDLYYRLKVVTLEVPPLRERLEDIPTLAKFFLEDSTSSREGEPVRGIEPAALDLLRAHRWPGNIRELRNVIQRAAVLGRGDRIRAEDIDLGQVLAVPVRGEPTAGFLPNDRQRQLLALLAERGALTTKEYFEEAQISRRTALRDLRELLDRGVILREGSRKAAVYRLSSRL